MNVTRTFPSRQGFIVDPGSINRNHGRQISWADVPLNFEAGGGIVAVTAPGAAPGATTIPVAALPVPIPNGSTINFGVKPAVVVTVGAAGAAINATSVPVAALTGPIPNGTTLSFGTNKFARLTADAPAGATALTVAAIPTALVSGDTATFAAGELFARVTADAAAGATALTVAALDRAVYAGDTATIEGPDTAPGGTSRMIPAGTVMSELTAGANKGKLVVRAQRPAGNTDPATCILETNANEDSTTDALTGYGCILGGVLFENLLPDADKTTGLLPAGFKTELQAAGVGTGFGWQQYGDSRAD